MPHKLFVPTVMCNVVGGGDDNKYLMHRVPLLELQRSPVIVSSLDTPPSSVCVCVCVWRVWGQGAVCSGPFIDPGYPYSACGCGQSKAIVALCGLTNRVALPLNAQVGYEKSKRV